VKPRYARPKPSAAYRKTAAFMREIYTQPDDLTADELQARLDAAIGKARR